MEKPVRVRIFDHEYLIKSDEDEAYVQTIARYVNEKFWEIKEHTEGLSVNRTAILAAFHIASEYFQLYQKVLRAKWKSMTITEKSGNRIAGRGDDGAFLLRQDGATVTSLEGLESLREAKAIPAIN